MQNYKDVKESLQKISEQDEKFRQHYQSFINALLNIKEDDSLVNVIAVENIDDNVLVATENIHDSVLVTIANMSFAFTYSFCFSNKILKGKISLSENLPNGDVNCLDYIIFNGQGVVENIKSENGGALTLDTKHEAVLLALNLLSDAVYKNERFSID